MRESRMQGQLACPVWRGLGRNDSQQWEDRAPLPPYMTYLCSAEPGVFWYLYSLLDHFSRKAVAWLIDERLSSDLAQRLWDQGLVNEGRLDLPHTQWPQSLSDRGAPMRSHSTRHYFKKLGIGQLFSRPRTPNDKGYAAYCTSFERSETTSGMRRRSASFRPRCLVGASAVGGS